VSAYAPDSSRPFEEHEDFEAQKQRCYESMKWHDILVERTDASASLGVRDRHDNNEAMGCDRVMGRYGIPLVNAAGRKMLQMLGIHKLCVYRQVISGKHLAINMSSFYARRDGILPESQHFK
jgi:hypothetical protein